MLVVFYRRLGINMTCIAYTAIRPMLKRVVINIPQNHKTGSKLRIAKPSEEVRATATGNMHKDLVKFSRMVFEFCKLTDIHTILITLHTPPGDEVNIIRHEH